MNEPVKLNLQLTFSDEQAAARAAPLIQERLSAPEVVEVWATVRQPRLTGLEIAGVVAVTALVLSHTKDALGHAADAVQQLRRLVQQIRDLVQDCQAKGADVYVGTRRVPLEELSDDDLQALAQPSG